MGSSFTLGGLLLLCLVRVKKLILAFVYSSAEKPALDPNVVKMWTLSANDMNDDDVVSS